MQLDPSTIAHPEVRQFYRLYWMDRTILRDFYDLLPEKKYDYRMVDTPVRRSDTPRESLAHLIYVQQIYLEGVRSGVLEYKSLGTEHHAWLPKDALLAEWDRTDSEMFAYLTGPDFDPARLVAVFWGGAMPGLPVLYFLRDHAILHAGWNLALMDHLDLPRYDSLRALWG